MKEKKSKEKKVKEEEKLPGKSGWRENMEAILIAFVLALIIRTFFIQAFKIPSGSMLNTLQIGDHILVNKFIYGVKAPFFNKIVIPVKKPASEDIIVFKYPKNPRIDYIKRVIGVAGDRVEIHNKKVYINGELVEKRAYEIHEDPYVLRGCPPGASPEARCHRDNYGPVVVPDNSLFVMGDNRENSTDSRFWGFVDVKAVKGKAVIIYWSWDRDKFNARWRRLGKLLK